MEDRLSVDNFDDFDICVSSREVLNEPSERCIAEINTVFCVQFIAGLFSSWKIFIRAKIFILKIRFNTSRRMDARMLSFCSS